MSALRALLVVCLLRLPWQRRRHRYGWSGFNRTTFEVQPRPQTQVELNLVIVIKIALR